MVWAVSWAALNKNVYVVGHDLHCGNFPTMLKGNFLNDFFETNFNISGQYFTPILRTPNQVIANVVNATA